MAKTVWSGLIPLVAVVALWAPAAQASWTCDELLQNCLYMANQDPDSRVREIYTDACYADWNTCQSYPECGDYICQNEEATTCPSDCGPAYSSNNMSTVEGSCSSSAPSTSSSRG